MEGKLVGKAKEPRRLSAAFSLITSGGVLGLLSRGVLRVHIKQVVEKFESGDHRDLGTDQETKG